MLALTRRIGEEVVIGDPRKPLGIIRVVSVRGDKVRLSFDFPRDTPINRRELAEQKLSEQSGEAGSAGPPPETPDAPKTPNAPDASGARPSAATPRNP